MSLVWEQETPHTGRISAPGGRTVAKYSYSPEKNNPYFWDLRPLNHDGVLSNHAPWDHRWHHGLWWSWKFINDVLYWEDHEAYGGPRKGLGRAHVTEHDVEQGVEGPVIRERVEWRENASGAAALRESRSMALATEPEIAGGWRIDWDHEWTAPREARLSATPYPEHSWGGYGGLNFRPARSLSFGEEILGSGGRNGRSELHGRPAEWAAYAGVPDGAYGHTRDEPAHGGLAILVHPENWRAPMPVYAYSAEENFGFLAVAPLMLRDDVLETGATLRLRFRTVVFGTKPDATQLQALHDRYAR